jgi:hypothetical protein
MVDGLDNDPVDEFPKCGRKAYLVVPINRSECNVGSATLGDMAQYDVSTGGRRRVETPHTAASVLNGSL